MKKLLLLALLVLPLTAQAAPPLVTEKDCQYLVSHHNTENINQAEYQPGVDVHGKPVVEADITAPVVTAPEVYSFDVSIDVAEYMGITVPEGVEGKTKIGKVTVKDGKAYFNDKPLEGDAEAALYALCGEQKKPAK